MNRETFIVAIALYGIACIFFHEILHGVLEWYFCRKANYVCKDCRSLSCNGKYCDRKRYTSSRNNKTGD